MKLSDKQLTDIAIKFFKAKGNEDVDSIYMTEDGNVFHQKDLRYAQGHSHNTETGEVIQFFREKVLGKKSNDSKEVDSTDQKSNNKADKKAAAEAKAKEKADEKKKKEEEEEESFDDQVKRIGDMSPEERQKELALYEDGEDKDALNDGILKYLEENKPAKASTLPEKFQKPLADMNEDELIDLAMELGSKNSQASLRKSKMGEIVEHVEDLAAKKDVELIK